MGMKEKLGESWRMSDFGWPLLVNLTPLRKGAAQSSRWHRADAAAIRRAGALQPRKSPPKRARAFLRGRGREGLIVELVSEQSLNGPQRRSPEGAALGVQHLRRRGRWHQSPEPPPGAPAYRHSFQWRGDGGGGARTAQSLRFQSEGFAKCGLVTVRCLQPKRLEASKEFVV